MCSRYLKVLDLAIDSVSPCCCLTIEIDFSRCYNSLD